MCRRPSSNRQLQAEDNSVYNPCNNKMRLRRNQSLMISLRCHFHQEVDDEFVFYAHAILKF